MVQALTVPGRLRSLDCLRGTAALAVVVHHAMNYGDYQAIHSRWFQAISTVTQEGHLGVPLFFVISGFCIHLQFVRQFKERGRAQIRFGAFWRRRIARLYPPYLVVLCLSMSLVIVAYLKHLQVPLVLMYPEPRSKWITLDFLSHVFMLHGFIPLFDKGGGNSPLWTLAREEYLYFMYFGLLFLRRFMAFLASTWVTFLLGVGFQVMMSFFVSKDSGAWGLVTSSALALWIQWHLGAVAVEAHYGLIKLPAWSYWLGMVPVWAIAAKVSETQAPLLTPVLWGLTFFTLVNYCTRRETMGRWSKRGVIGWLGEVGVFSYSLYLVHSPVRGVAKQLLGPWGRTASPLIYCLIAVFIGACGYFAGKVFFKAVESRFLRTSRST